MLMTLPVINNEDDAVKLFRELGYYRFYYNEFRTRCTFCDFDGLFLSMCYQHANGPLEKIRKKLMKEDVTHYMKDRFYTRLSITQLFEEDDAEFDTWFDNFYRIVRAYCFKQENVMCQLRTVSEEKAPVSKAHKKEEDAVAIEARKKEEEEATARYFALEHENEKASIALALKLSR